MPSAANREGRENMQRPLYTYAPVACSLIASAVFSASLGFRFSSAPPTRKIFGKSGTRVSGFRSEGLFARTEPLIQYLIGSAGRAASWPLIAAEVMRLAASLHLCALLGMDRNDYPGGLFAHARAIWPR